MAPERKSDIVGPDCLDGGNADTESARLGQKRQREENDCGSDAKERDALVQSGVSRQDKRRRTARAGTSDAGPAVHVTYERLTRESKAKLTELLKYWSQWHGQNQNSTDPATESGTVIYFPPSGLDTGSFFWVDKPRNSGNVSTPKPETTPKDFNLHYEQDCEVPQYDRSANAALCSERDSQEGGDGVYLRIEKDAPRCWNCASYTHSARECPKPRDQEAFNAAREEFNAKRGVRPGETSQRRYFQGGAYDDLKPGVLTTPLREALGIQADDPPPWLRRMRELGYPPGYIANEDGADSPSGIEVFGLDEGDDLGAPSPAADVSRAPAADVSKSLSAADVIKSPGADISDAPRKQLVDFPGINAPIPDGADPRKWEDRNAAQEIGWRRYGGWSERRGASPDGFRSTDVRSNGASDGRFDARERDGFSGMHRGPDPTAGNGNHAAGYGAHVGGYEGHVAGYEGHVADYEGHNVSYGGHATGYAGHVISYASHVTENGGRAGGYGEQVLDYQGQQFNRGNDSDAFRRPARDGSTPPRKRPSRWDAGAPEHTSYSNSWPGASDLARLAERDGPGGPGDAVGDRKGVTGGSANGFEDGGEMDMDTEPDDFPPGYETAQQWQTGGAYAYQHGGASQGGSPQPPGSFYSPSPPPPPSYTPSPPPPPKYSPPPFPPGYSEPREITPPGYSETPPLYGQLRQDSASPQPAFASPESLYTPERHFPVSAQPVPPETWRGFWPQNHQR